jgi:acyl carrier protein
VGIYERLTPIFREVFDDDELMPSPSMTARDVVGWDSLTHIRLILSVEEAFQIAFTAAEVSAFQNVGDFARLIETRLAGSDARAGAVSAR